MMALWHLSFVFEPVKKRNNSCEKTKQFLRKTWLTMDGCGQEQGYSVLGTTSYKVSDLLFIAPDCRDRIQKVRGLKKPTNKWSKLCCAQKGIS